MKILAKILIPLAPKIINGIGFILDKHYDRITMLEQIVDTGKTKRCVICCGTAVIITVAMIIAHLI